MEFLYYIMPFAFTGLFILSAILSFVFRKKKTHLIWNFLIIISIISTAIYFTDFSYYPKIEQSVQQILDYEEFSSDNFIENLQEQDFKYSTDRYYEYYEKLYDDDITCVVHVTANKDRDALNPSLYSKDEYVKLGSGRSIAYFNKFAPLRRDDIIPFRLGRNSYQVIIHLDNYYVLEFTFLGKGCFITNDSNKFLDEFFNKTIK